MHSIFKTRLNIARQFDPIYEFYTGNLIVSGCSFTHNHSDNIILSWPYFLRDLGGFREVLDCSIPGAGNNHISDALIWGLEVEQPVPENSLVVVMWSGCDRDDYICPASIIRPKTLASFNYTEKVMSGQTGGSYSNVRTNTIIGDTFKQFASTKDHYSRAIENYLVITKTWHYLTSKGYNFVFLNFLDSTIPSKTLHFDIRKYLPKKLSANLDKMMLSIIDPYTCAVNNNMLGTDNYHPSAEGHLLWTREFLLPKLQNTFFRDGKGTLINKKKILFQKLVQ
jgi:hypothetical protein